MARVLPEHVTLHQPDAAGAAEFRQLDGGAVTGERGLFAEDVFARKRRFAHPLIVERRRRGDVNRVNFGIGEPPALGRVIVLDTGTTTGFVPIQIDPSIRDRRYLGAWIEPRLPVEEPH